jgi:hypothetical protein
MERGLNLNDPRLKKYLDSLKPEYRDMVEALYSPDPAVRNAKLRKLAAQQVKKKEGRG